MSEVREVRTQEIKLIKYDDPFGNTRYTGRSSSIRGLDSEPVWQIMREHKNCVTGVTTETHANMGEYNCVWDDRVSYFPVAAGSDACSIFPAVSLSGSIATTPSGLRTAGKHSFISVNSTGWTKLPTTPLPDRNGLAIMNYSGIDIMLRYVEGIADLTYQGTLLAANSGLKFYDIKDTIDIYGMSASGTPSITVEEIS